jgi:hypothetical protein
MDREYEASMSASELKPKLVSPHMLPQLNETVCGCRCGCGCGCAGHGSGERVSGSDTAVETSESDDDEGFSSGFQTFDDNHDGGVASQAYHTVLSPRVLSRQRIVWLMDRTEDLQIGEPLAGWEQVLALPPLYDGYDDLPESLVNEAPGTESQSNAVSDHESVQMMSPGPGIGTWLDPEKTWVDDVQLVYYFNVRPLRLSAEYQHARGRAVEHLLVRDEESFLDEKR